jgi:hypothetical protein
MGARSAGNPHAACDVEGTGNVARSKGLPARRSSTLLIGGIEETSASFEARSAPRSYPTEAPIAGPARARAS